jgi:plasmid maintenance system killer protein
MKYEFKNKHLIQLYTEGKNKKYKFLDKRSVRKFIKCIGIDAAKECSTTQIV